MRTEMRRWRPTDSPLLSSRQNVVMKNRRMRRQIYMNENGNEDTCWPPSPELEAVCGWYEDEEADIYENGDGETCWPPSPELEAVRQQLQGGQPERRSCLKKIIWRLDWVQKLGLGPKSLDWVQKLGLGPKAWIGSQKLRLGPTSLDWVQNVTHRFGPKNHKQRWLELIHLQQAVCQHQSAEQPERCSCLQVLNMSWKHIIWHLYDSS